MNKRKARHTRFRLGGRKTPVMLVTASAQVCVPLGHSSLYLLNVFVLSPAYGNVELVTLLICALDTCCTNSETTSSSICMSSLVI